MEEIVKRHHGIAVALFLLPFSTLLLPSCRKVEGTGRNQLVLTPEATENKLGADAYKDIVAKEKRSTDPAAIELVTRVGQRLVAVAPNRGFQYEFTVLESDSINAFCLPGGKVCVYTGILSYCQNEAGLAAVMGHEIAHAIARHGGERPNQPTGKLPEAEKLYAAAPEKFGAGELVPARYRSAKK